MDAEFRLRLGALLAETTRVVPRSWLLLVVIAPVACLPMVVAWILSLVILQGMGMGHSPDVVTLWVGLLAANWICYCSEIAAVQIWTIGIAPSVLARARRERGMPATAQPRALALGLGTAWLCLYRIASNVVLLVVPGVVQAVRLFVAVPAAINDRQSAHVAAVRSAQLVRGSGMRVFGLLLLLRLVRTVLSAALATASASGRQQVIPVYSVLYWLLPVPFVVFEAVASAVAYVQLRGGKETLDVDATAQVFR